MENQNADIPGAAFPQAADDENTEKGTSKTVDENFYKIFMQEFKTGLGGIKSRRLRLVLWLIEHMSLKNELRYTYAEMAGEAGVSLQTVADTIQGLEKKDFLRRKGKRLVINPCAVFKGTYANRCRVMKTYFEPGGHKNDADDSRDGHRKNKKREVVLQADKKTDDKNFFKVFMKDFENGLDGIDSMQLRVILWIIKHMSLKNELNYSYREIAEASGTSLHTVAVTIKSLEENGFLRRTIKGMMVNPDAVFKGRLSRREDALYAYDLARPLSEEEINEKKSELDSIQKQITLLAAQKKELADRLAGELAELERLTENIELYANDKKRLSGQIELAEKVKLREKHGIL